MTFRWIAVAAAAALTAALAGTQAAAANTQAMREIVHIQSTYTPDHDGTIIVEN